MRGTPGELGETARLLGRLQARIHSNPVAGSPARAIAERIASDPSGFVTEQARVAVAYAAEVRQDFLLFRDARERLGETLGLARGPEDAPSAELASLYGAPPK